jgi:MFS family permease
MASTRHESGGLSTEEKATGDDTPVTWLSLPRKGQLAILAMGRFVDFYHMASLQAYMVYQLKSFDPNLSDETISWQAGILQGSFTFVQIFTSVLWGRMADREWCGRKLVLLIGLVGTGISCIGLAFSTSFLQASVYRALGGAINGTVSVS